MGRTLKDRLLFRRKEPTKNDKASPFQLSSFTPPDASKARSADTKPRSNFSKLKESTFRFFGAGKSKSTSVESSVLKKNSQALEPPRLSCDSKIGSRYQQVIEPPRRSLDSRILLGYSNSPEQNGDEPARRSFDVSILSRLRDKQHQQRSNIVAKLMGLPELVLEASYSSPCHKLLEVDLDLLRSELENTNTSEKYVRSVPPAPAGRNFSMPSPERKQSTTTTRRTTGDVNSRPKEYQEQASIHSVVQRLERLQRMKEAQEDEYNRLKETEESLCQSWDSGSLEGHQLFLDSEPRLRLNLKHRQEQEQELQEVLRESSKRLQLVEQQDHQITNSKASLEVFRSFKSSPGHVKNKRSEFGTGRVQKLKTNKICQGNTFEAKPAISSRIPAATPAATTGVTRKRNLLTTCQPGYKLMRPTIASSARQTQPRDSEKRGSSLRNPRRDHTESRAALARNKSFTKAVVRPSRTADEKPPLALKKNEEKAPTNELAWSSSSSELKADSPESDTQCCLSKAIVENFENLSSPVSVLDVVYDEQDEQLITGSAGPVHGVTKVELDKKFTAQNCVNTGPESRLDSHRWSQCLSLFRAGALVDEEQECIQHWSKQPKNSRGCSKCVSGICHQLDAAIFDDLVYEAIIQLDAQHLMLSR